MTKQSEGIHPAKRFRYTEDYRVKRQVLADGSIDEQIKYVGPYAVPTHPIETYRKAKTRSRVDAVVTACAVLFLLLVRDFAVYQGGLYVFVPVTMAGIPTIYLILGVLKLPKEDRMLRRDTLQFAHRRIQRSAVGILLLFCGASLLTGLFFILSGATASRADVLFFALLLLPIGCNIQVIREIGFLKYTECREQGEEPW